MNVPIRLPTRQDYEPHVAALLPGCAGEELSLRAALLLMRDKAAAAKLRASEEAYPLLDHVERVAGSHAFAGMPLTELGELRRILVMLVASANSLEAFHQRRNAAWEGSDARG